VYGALPFPLLGFRAVNAVAATVVGGLADGGTMEVAKAVHDENLVADTQS
jgi:hypothetical protein